MRISGPKRNTTVSAKSKAGGAASASGGFKIAGGAKPSSARGAQGVRSLAAVDALISIQEVPDATARRAKAVARAETILDLLDDIKLALLSGAMPRSRMTKLTRIVADARSDVSSEHLSGVLDEIELRAKVELAKLEKAA